jgi:hypothetical protein
MLDDCTFRDSDGVLRWPWGYPDGKKKTQSLPGDIYLSFDGVNDYIDVSSLSTNNQFTIEMWSYPIDTGQSLQYVLDSTSGRFTFATHNNNTGEGWSVQDGSWVQFQDYVSWGKWQHVAIVIDVTNSEASLYLDGSFVSNKSFSSNSIGGTTYIARSPGGTNYHSGYLSDIRFWNGIRTQKEIEANKDNPLKGTEDGLIAYYKLDEGGGSIATDSAGNNDGTIYGATWVEDTPF